MSRRSAAARSALRIDSVWLDDASRVVLAHAFHRDGFWPAGALPALPRPPQSEAESLLLEGLLARAGLRRLSSGCPGRHGPDLGERAQDRARRAVGLICRRHAEPLLRATDIADALHVSEWTLSRSLNGVTGRGFPRHLAEARTDAARPLVEATDLLIGEVARRVGFTRERDLTDAFRFRFGSSPSVWRRRHRLAESNDNSHPAGR